MFLQHIVWRFDLCNSISPTPAGPLLPSLQHLWSHRFIHHHVPSQNPVRREVPWNSSTDFLWKYDWLMCGLPRRNALQDHHHDYWTGKNWIKRSSSIIVITFSCRFFIWPSVGWLISYFVSEVWTSSGTFYIVLSRQSTGHTQRLFSEPRDNWTLRSELSR